MPHDFGISAGARVTLSVACPRRPHLPETSTYLRDLGNVGAASLQMLALLGYRKVLMVGVDGRYLPERADEADVNHFSDAYARGRKPLTAADQRHYTAGWPLAAKECRRLGMEVRNASSGTALSYFETCGLGEGLDWLAPTGAEASVGALVRN